MPSGIPTGLHLSGADTFAMSAASIANKLRCLLSYQYPTCAWTPQVVTGPVLQHTTEYSRAVRKADWPFDKNRPFAK